MFTSILARSDSEENDGDEPENELGTVVEEAFEELRQDGELPVPATLDQSVNASEIEDPKDN